MTDDLRRAMEAEAGSSGGLPELADLWHQGRHRRTVRRRIKGAGVAAIVLVVGLVGVQVVQTDGSQSVRTADGSDTCDPRAVVLASVGSVSQSATIEAAPQPPRSAAAMVHGGGSEHLAEPDIVARVTVESIDQRSPKPQTNERYLNTSGERRPVGERRARVVVTDAIAGTEVGKRFTISDFDSERRMLVTREQTRQAQDDIVRYQAAYDELAQPLANLDAQIMAMNPEDPRYEGLVRQYQTLKDATEGKSIPLQNKLSDAKQRLQLIQINERLQVGPVAGTPCHRFQVGDDLVVALTFQQGTGRYELTGSSSFFLVEGDGFSEELDAARRSVDGWSDSPLLALARRSTPDQFVDRLRQAAGN